MGVDLIKLQLFRDTGYFHTIQQQHFHQNFLKCFKGKKCCLISGRCQHYKLYIVFTIRGRFDKLILFKKRGYYIYTFFLPLVVFPQ